MGLLVMLFDGDEVVTWRAVASIWDRIFGALAYLLPLFYGMQFGSFLMQMFPILQFLLIPILPIAIIYSIPLAGIIVFMGLYLLVVRNSRVSYFIRYNTMQALLMGIVIFLLQLVLMVFNMLGSFDFVEKVFSNFVFIAVLAGVIFSVVQSLRGVYAELPTISDATKSQVF